MGGLPPGKGIEYIAPGTQVKLIKVLVESELWGKFNRAREKKKYANDLAYSTI